MTPHAYSPLGIFEPILLLVFTLMLFAGLAGGNAAMVLKPLFEIFAQLLGAFLSIFCALLSTALRVGFAFLLSAGQKLLSGLQEHSERNSNR